jgi:integrase
MPRKLPAGISWHKATERYIGRFVFRAKGQTPKRETVYGKTVTECQRAMTARRVELEVGTPEGAAKMTLGAFLDWYLDTDAVDAYRPRIRANYRRIADAEIIPRIGFIGLADLQPAHVEQVLTAMRLAQKDDRPHARVKAFELMRRTLNRAVDRDVIAKNPCDKVTSPKAPKSEMKTWTAEQANIYLAAARSDRLYALYVLALRLGLRQGELFGLRWEDLDLEGANLTVQRSLGRDLTTGKTKTDASRRRLHLPAACVLALDAHAPMTGRQGYVFTSPKGGPLRQSNVYRRSFLPLLEKAKVPAIRFHDLRHTFATLALLAGVHPKVVSEILGHADVSITLRVYSHVLPTMQADAQAKMDAVFEPEPPVE